MVTALLQRSYSGVPVRLQADGACVARMGGQRPDGRGARFSRMPVCPRPALRIGQARAVPSLSCLSSLPFAPLTLQTLVNSWRFPFTPSVSLPLDPRAPRAGQRCVHCILTGGCAPSGPRSVWRRASRAKAACRKIASLPSLFRNAPAPARLEVRTCASSRIRHCFMWVCARICTDLVELALATCCCVSLFEHRRSVLPGQPARTLPATPRQHIALSISCLHRDFSRGRWA